jgi:hypothetical protein
MTHEVVGSGQGETRMPEHIGLSPAEEGWTVANVGSTLQFSATTTVMYFNTGKRAGTITTQLHLILRTQATWTAIANAPPDESSRGNT